MRSAEEIKAIMEADVPAELKANTSKTAEWRMWIDVFALIVHGFEGILDLFKRDIQALVDTNITGSLEWYRRISRAFQYSSAETGSFYLIVDQAGRIVYNALNTAAQIIKQATIKENESDMTLKVATETGGELAALSSDALQQFTSYINQRKLPGDKINIVSANPDELYIEATVKYNGTYSGSELEMLIRSHLSAFARDFEFDGMLYVNDILLLILGTDGVRDAGITLCKLYQGVNEITVIGQHEVSAGYFTVRPDCVLNMSINA